jgi:hypothetical protein
MADDDKTFEDRIADALFRIASSPKTTAAAYKKQRQAERKEAAAEQKTAALTAQAEQTTAALTEQATAIAAARAALEECKAAFAASIEEAHDHLRGYYNSIAEADRHLRYRIMNYAGLLHGYNAQLQELPDWPAIKQMVPDLSDLPVTPPAEVVSENVREDWSGHTFIADSSLTRTVRGAA